MGKISKLYKRIIYKLKPKINLDKLNLEHENLEELFNYFGSDKGSLVSKIHGNDPNVKKKYPGHSYHEFYEKYLNKIKNKNFNLLEIGAYKGASIAAFYFYFKKANIFCIDKNFKFQFKSSRVKFYNCNTKNFFDLEKLKNFLGRNNSKNFDLIIDDGSHLLSDIKKNFLFFFEFLNPGGFYIIEDFNHSNYYNLENLKNEQSIDAFLESIKQKRNFSSSIKNFNSKNKLFEQILNVYKHKGKMILNKDMLIAQDGLVSEEVIKKLENINVSDIAFIQKK